MISVLLLTTSVTLASDFSRYSQISKSHKPCSKKDPRGRVDRLEILDRLDYSFFVDRWLMIRRNTSRQFDETGKRLFSSGGLVRLN
mmetsp:Transcript_5452/g.11249  ORF Transcript_5452/g.11249 Transcript_5452/m.11249 type:complete len:86 (-) Transcript_5452:75-332(-)